jgi:hypothetical protein
VVGIAQTRRTGPDAKIGLNSYSREPGPSVPTEPVHRPVRFVQAACRNILGLRYRLYLLLGTKSEHLDCSQVGDAQPMVSIFRSQFTGESTQSVDIDSTRVQKCLCL